MNPETQRHLRFFEPAPFDPSRLTKSYRAHGYHGEHEEYREGHGIERIHLDQGQLVIDDLPVLEPRMSHDVISWAQQIGGHYTSGHLTFEKGGTELHGVVFRGVTAADAEEHNVIATALDCVTYATRITRECHRAGTDPDSLADDAWTAGPELEVCNQQEESEPGEDPHDITPLIKINGVNVMDYGLLSVDDQSRNVLELLGDPDVDTPDDQSEAFLGGKIVFGAMDPTFSGTVDRICRMTDDGDALCRPDDGEGSYFWKGEVQPAAVESMAAESMGAHNEMAAMAAPMPAPMPLPVMAVQLADVQHDPHLSMAELMSIVPDQKVSDRANDMLVENMKWAMGEDPTEKKWLEHFLGTTQPSLNDDRKKLVTKGKSFYVDKFAKAYLGWSFANYAGEGAPSVKLTDAQKTKLKAYLQTGMAKEKDFNEQQNGIYLQAFIDAKPELQRYLDDNPADWARMAFKWMTSPAQRIQMRLRIFANKARGMHQANNYATLLMALGADDLAREYMKLLLHITKMGLVIKSTWKTQSRDEILEWLPDFLEEFLRTLATKQHPPDQAKIVAEQLRGLKEHLDGKMTLVAAEMADFMIGARGVTIISKSNHAERAFRKKFPKFAEIGKLIFFTAFTTGVIFVTKGIRNWKDLSKEDRAKVVTTAVELGLSTLDVVPEAWGGLKRLKANASKGWKKLKLHFESDEFREWAAQLEEIKAEMAEMDDMIGGYLELNVGGELKVAGTFWEKFFAKGAKVAGVAGVAISAVFAVFATIDFVKALKDPRSSDTAKALVGITAVANIATFVCLAVDVVVSSVACAVAAGVLAIVGLIVGIIMMYVIKPKNPLDDFMEKVIIPFVDSLGPQTPSPVPAGSHVRLQ